MKTMTMKTTALTKAQARHNLQGEIEALSYMVATETTGVTVNALLALDVAYAPQAADRVLRLFEDTDRDMIVRTISRAQVFAEITGINLEKLTAGLASDKA